MKIPSPTNYYNGDLKLNVIKVKCKTYANETDCLHQSNCGIFIFFIFYFLGWCGSNGTCVAGSGAGPFEPCVKGAYIFAKPKPNFNPSARIVNENVGGVKLTVVSK